MTSLVTIGRPKRGRTRTKLNAKQQCVAAKPYQIVRIRIVTKCFWAAILFQTKSQKLEDDFSETIFHTKFNFKCIRLVRPKWRMKKNAKQARIVTISSQNVAYGPKLCMELGVHHVTAFPHFPG